MRSNRNKTVYEPEQPEAYSFESVIPDVTAQPDDAFLRSEYVEEAEPAPARKRSSFFGRFLRTCLSIILVVGLCGLSWAGGAFYSHNLPPIPHIPLFDFLTLKRSADDTTGALHDMADQIRTLQASVEAVRAAQAAEMGNAAAGDSLSKQLDSVQATTTTAIADLAGMIDKLQTDSTTKLTQLGEQLDGLEHRLPAPRVASTVAAAPRKKRVDQPHDAFEPSHGPGAPGAPLSLGSLPNGSTAGQNGF